MSLSFSTAPGALCRTRDVAGLPVLVTGAGGRIGSWFCEHAADRYKLRMLVHTPEKHRDLERFGEVVPGDVGDLDGLKRACEGIDTVVHLAGDPSPGATWDSLLEKNIAGTYHVMVAARSAGCRRLIFASSIHAVSGYAPDIQVKTSDPVNPGDLYGVSKCFGEALGRYMAEKEGLSVIALRIGAFQPRERAHDPGALWMLDAFVSRRDLTELIHRCIENDNLGFAIFHGLSDNRFKRLDISDARELVNYQPQDDFTEENEALGKLHLSAEVLAHSRSDSSQQTGLRGDLGPPVKPA